MSDRQSRAQFLVRETLKARQQGKDPRFMTRLIESIDGSLHGPDVTADVADLALAATLKLAEVTGESFESVLEGIDAPGVARAADTDSWLAPAAA